MMQTILIAVFLLLASLSEAVAHFGIIGTTWGRDETRVYKTSNRTYHIAFSVMWGLILAVLCLIGFKAVTIGLLYLVYRMTIFNWFLNHLIGHNFDAGRPIWHLSDKGMDGWIKKRIGEGLWFLISFAILLASVASFLAWVRI